ncbi:MAG: hypothetical protein COX07_04090 [Bacteroidetes bacterium CG23_combo_of_CG06-09_8_20_14_all_32_9]|nr:MAG: hypothetical protein COX07_04090 [Bacteroidetes bacterium CG23_combo_of_CG06-09_8_20_14_all_32_9]
MKEEQKNNEILKLIAGSLTNEISLENRKKLDKWILESSENHALYNNYVKTWKLFNQTELTNEINIDAEWNHLKRLTRISDKKLTGFKPAIFMRYAAAIIIIVSITTLAYIFTLKTPQKELVAKIQMIENTLPDGSVVSLNSGSKLTYPETFRSDKRKVSLSGEAFFEVTSNPLQPFIIDAGNVIIEVVGTSFYVRSIPGEINVEVIVKTGKVAVYTKNNPSQKKLLIQGEHGIFNFNETNIEKLPENNENYIGWKTHKLSFKNETLKNVVHTLERTYNKNISVSSSVSNCTITVTFNNQSFDAVINVLKATLNIQIIQKENYVEISGQGCRL